MQLPITVNIKNGLLLGAVTAMLEECGHEIVSEGDGIAIVSEANAETIVVTDTEQKKSVALKLPIVQSDLDEAIVTLFGGEADDEPRHDELKLDVKNRRAVLGRKRAELTEKECMLLALLLKHKGNTVSDAEITEKIWKNEVVTNSNIAAVYINYLRTKLEAAFDMRLIYRVRGEGYMLKEIERKS